MIAERIEKMHETINWFGHCFMTTLLVLIVMTYLKATYVYDSLSFIITLAIPASALSLIGGAFLYQKYVSKLFESHVNIYGILTAFLVIWVLSFSAFIWLLSVYLENPTES